MKYGKDKASRLYLHANHLILINPKTKKEMEFISSVPKLFDNLFERNK